MTATHGRVHHRRGQALLRDGVPYGDPETTLSLLPAACMGEWLSAYAALVHGDLLDLGCGNAPFADWYAGRVAKAVRYDAVPGRGVDVVGLAEQLPFREKCFDVVLATEVLEHTDDDVAALAAVYEVLRPGGHLLATVPFVYPVHEAPYDYRRYTHFGLQQALGRAGFEVVSLEAKGGLGVVAAHWASMVTVATVQRVGARLGRDLLASSRTRAALAAPQRLLVRRGISRSLQGTAAWATLGYLAVARRPE